MKKTALILSLFLGVASAAHGEGTARWVQRLQTAFGPSWIESKAPKTEAVQANEAVITPLWLPMCFLFDASADAKQANQKIQKMVRAYGACGISLRPHVFTLKDGYPTDPTTLGEAARMACPIPKAFGVRGAIQIESRTAEQARKMCNDSEAQGCSTLCAPLSLSFVAPSADAGVALHESMHSNCCGPLCVDEGEGSGRIAGPKIELAQYTVDISTNRAATVSAIEEPDVSAEGCEALRAGASPNAIGSWYQPMRETYYEVERDPSNQVDLSKPKSLFQLKAAPAVSFVETPKTLTGADSKLLTAAAMQLPIPEVNREPKSKSPVVPIPKDEPLFKPLMEDSPRNRGAGLRKQGKSSIGFIDSYGGDSE